MVYLTHALGVPPKYLTRLMQQPPTQSHPNVVIDGPTDLPVLTSFTATTIVYSPLNLFLHHRVHEHREADVSFTYENENCNTLYIAKKPKPNSVCCPTMRWISGSTSVDSGTKIKTHHILQTSS